MRRQALSFGISSVSGFSRKNLAIPSQGTGEWFMEQHRGAHGFETRNFGQRLDSKGLKALNEGRPHEAIQAWSEMLEDIDKRSTKDSPARLGPLNNLACAFGELGDHWKQTQLLEEVLDTSRGSYGKEHQQCAVALYNLANAAGGIGKYKKMESLLKEAILITAKNFHPKHAKVARCMILLAESMEGQEKFDYQVGLLVDSEKIILKHVGKTHQQWTSSWASWPRPTVGQGRTLRQSSSRRKP